MNTAELIRRMKMAASQVKLSTGVCNNAAWAACLEAHDHIRKHSRYRHKANRAYKQALEEFHAYERRLLYADKNRMFNVADMDYNTRKIYGDITDKQYYEFWTGIGATTYYDTRPLVTSLVNKYRLSLIKHDVPQAQLLAWPLAAWACLEIARHNYEVTLQVISDQQKLTMSVLKEVFGQFSLERVQACWQKAMVMTDPVATSFKLDEIEVKNITLGIDQLTDAWVDTGVHLGKTSKTMKDFEEVFRTKGEMKKAIREVTDLEHEIQEQYEREREQQHIAAITHGTAAGCHTP